MWRNCKFCIAVIFGFFVFWQMGVFAQDTTSDDAYCQSISICGSSAKEFTLMIEFSQEILNAIKTVGTEWSYLGKFVNPNRFVWDKFSPPAMGILGKAATSIAQKLDFLLATTAIFTSPQQWWWLKDIFAGILILFKNKVFARDMQRVEKLDSAVTQTRYELGLWWGWTKTVRSENVKKFQKVMSDYVAKWLLDKNSKISDGVKYNAITAMAGRIDSALKSFLSLNTTDQFTSFTKWGSDGITIVFSQSAIESMNRQYDCARWTKNMCDTTAANFIKNMKSIGSGAADKVKKSIKTFSDAGKRLTQIFSNDPSYKAREDELLNAYYGNQKRKKWVSIKWVTLPIAIGVDTAWIFSQWRSATIEDQSKNTSVIDQTKLTTAATNQTWISVTNLSNTNPDLFAQWMFAGMTPILDEQQRDLSLINFAEVKDFSPYFNQLWEKLLVIRNLIWDKEKKTSLTYIVGSACELQCEWSDKNCW